MTNWGAVKLGLQVSFLLWWLQPWLPIFIYKWHFHHTFIMRNDKEFWISLWDRRLENMVIMIQNPDAWKMTLVPATKDKLSRSDFPLSYQFSLMLGSKKEWWQQEGSLPSLSPLQSPSLSFLEGRMFQWSGWSRAEQHKMHLRIQYKNWRKGGDF